jgi:hypothetical protein
MAARLAAVLGILALLAGCNLAAPRLLPLRLNPLRSCNGQLQSQAARTQFPAGCANPHPHADDREQR